MMGVLCSIGSVILWSAASVSIRKISGYYDPVQTALYGMVIALVFNVPAAVIENVFVTRSHPTAVAIGACLFVAVFGTAVAHTCWNKALQLLNASTCSMFYPLQPLVSAVMGVLLLHEVITPSCGRRSADLRRCGCDISANEGESMTDFHTVSKAFAQRVNSNKTIAKMGNC